MPPATTESAYDASLLGTREGVCRVAADDPELPALLRTGVPIVITGAALVSAEVRHRWASASYLTEQLGDEQQGRAYGIYEATAGVEVPRYAYHDFSDRCTSGQYVVPAPPKGPTRACTGSFRDFMDLRREKGDHFYLQTTIVTSPKAHEELEAEAERNKPKARGVTKSAATGKRVASSGGTALVDGRPEVSKLAGAIRRDLLTFNWAWLRHVTAHRPQGRPYGQSQLFVGGLSGVTPLHFDTYDNMLAQVAGTKRVLLVSPDQFERCYPFPTHHPQDRQSRLGALAAVDERRFPKWRGVRTLEAELLAGDVLHLPPYWWHQVQMMRPLEASTSSDTASRLNVSLNFWFMASPWEADSPAPVLPPDDLGYISPEMADALQRAWPKEVSLAPHQLVGLGRDIEATIATNLGPASVGQLLRKAMPEAGATEESWAPTLEEHEAPSIRSMNLALFSRGFSPPAAVEFLRALYRGRFEGLEQSNTRSAARGKAPDWWQPAGMS